MSTKIKHKKQNIKTHRRNSLAQKSIIRKLSEKEVFLYNAQKNASALFAKYL